MVRAATGLVLAGNALPDCLPLKLEFRAVAPSDMAAKLLSLAGPPLQRIRARAAGMIQHPCAVRQAATRLRRRVAMSALWHAFTGQVHGVPFHIRAGIAG